MCDDFEFGIFASLIVSPLYAFTLYYAVLKSAYGKFRGRNPAVHLHYSILELWGLTLGLTPTLASIAYGFGQQVLIENHTAYAVLVQLLAISQFSGIYLALLKNNEADDPHRFALAHGWGPALTIFLGALGGIALMAVIPVVALIGAIAFALIYLLFHGPLIIPLALVGYAIIWVLRVGLATGEDSSEASGESGRTHLGPRVSARF